jgi:hypothetical protein
MRLVAAGIWLRQKDFDHGQNSALFEFVGNLRRRPDNPTETSILWAVSGA